MNNHATTNEAVKGHFVTALPPKQDAVSDTSRYLGQNGIYHNLRPEDEQRFAELQERMKGWPEKTLPAEPVEAMVDGTLRTVAIIAEESTIQKVIITPEIAETYLRSMTGNRQWAESNLRRAALWILNGTWIQNHSDGIVFDWFCHLSHAQHRLMAVVVTGIPVVARIITGTDPAERRTHNDPKAANTKSQSVVYMLGKGVEAVVHRAVSDIMLTFEVPDFRERSGVNTSLERMLRAYASDLQQITRKLPGKGKYRCPELVGSLLLLKLASKTLFENAMQVFSGESLSGKAIRIRTFFHAMLSGDQVKHNREEPWRVMRLKGYLWALAGMTEPKVGVNGLTDENLREAIMDKLRHQAGLTMLTSESTFGDTVWVPRPNHVHDKIKTVRAKKKKK